MNYQDLLVNNQQRINTVTGSSVANIELCKVETVDENNMYLDIIRLNNAQKLTGIPFCMPSRYIDKGLIMLPEKGAIGVLATTVKQEFFIIGFLSYSSSESINEKLLSGEILLQSGGYGFLKMDNNGDVFIASSSENISHYGEKSIDNFSTNLKSVSAAKEIVSGIINNVVHEIEKCYDKDISTILTTEELINNVMHNIDVPISNPLPVLEIQKGNVLDENGNIVTLQLYSNPDNNPDACYELKVMNNGVANANILIGKDGSVQLVVNELSLKCETLDMTGVKNFTPNMFRYDAYLDTVEYKG